jgi:hypothetical protein
MIGQFSNPTTAMPAAKKWKLLGTGMQRNWASQVPIPRQISHKTAIWPFEHTCTSRLCSFLRICFMYITKMGTETFIARNFATTQLFTDLLSYLS